MVVVRAAKQGMPRASGCSALKDNDLPIFGFDHALKLLLQAANAVGLSAITSDHMIYPAAAWSDAVMLDKKEVQ